MRNALSAEHMQLLNTLSFKKRYLEPESMEETADEYAAMDFRATNTAFVEFISPLIAKGSYVVDMGCGPGEIALLLAQMRSDIRVCGVDLSPSMLAYATKKADEQNVHNIQWRHGDITAESLFSENEIDFAFSHTTLHHLSDLRPFFKNITHTVKPTGGFAFRDLRRPETSAHAVEWIRDAGVTTLTPRQFELFFYSLRASLTPEEVRTLAEEMQLQGTLEVTTQPDRYWVFYKSMERVLGL